MVKTSSEPPIMPGRLSGSITSKNVRTGPAPRLADASSSSGSMRWITVVSVRIMNGSNAWTRPMTTPVKLLMSGTG